MMLTPFGEHFFLAQPPSQARAILAVQKFQDLQELALGADSIIKASELHPNNYVAALSSKYYRNLQPKHKPKPNLPLNPISATTIKNLALTLVLADPAVLWQSYSQQQHHH